MEQERKPQIDGYATERPDANNGSTFLLAVGVIVAIAAVAWVFGTLLGG